MKRRIAVLLALLSLALGALAALAPAATADKPADAGVKVFVCKYVGTPGVDEVLQTGQNPIDVSVNAIPDYQGVGSYFADAQGQSYVLGPEHAASDHVPEPDVSECPSTNNTTTTEAPTTTTIPEETTTVPEETTTVPEETTTVPEQTTTTTFHDNRCDDQHPDEGNDDQGHNNPDCEETTTTTLPATTTTQPPEVSTSTTAPSQSSTTVAPPARVTTTSGPQPFVPSTVSTPEQPLPFTGSNTAALLAAAAVLLGVGSAGAAISDRRKRRTQ